MRKWLARSAVLFLGIASIYLLMLVYPNLLFSNYISYRNYQVYSDRPIDEKIKVVLDDAISRIEKSELYKHDSRFYLYLCSDRWRFKFFTRNESAGGQVNFVISGNIFIRENDIFNNRIIPPDTWRNPLTDRPLSYFIAHESVHSLQREYDKFMVLKTPMEIIEGYADFIAKGGHSNLNALIQDYKKGVPTMDPSNGLYDKYHLFVRYLIEHDGMSFETVLEEQPDLEASLKALL